MVVGRAASAAGEAQICRGRELKSRALVGQNVAEARVDAVVQAETDLGAAAEQRRDRHFDGVPGRVVVQRDRDAVLPVVARR